MDVTASGRRGRRPAGVNMHRGFDEGRVTRPGRARLGALLRACVTEHDWSKPVGRAVELARAVDGERLVAAARHHRVVGFVQRSLEGAAAIENATAARLWALYAHGMEREKRVLDDLRTVREALDGLGVPWLVVKGPVLTDVVYRRPGLRLYNDLDLLVPRKVFAQTVGGLEEAGFRVFDRNWQLIRREVAGEVHLTRGPGAGVDLHWHLLYDKGLRHSFPIPMEELVDRARAVIVDGHPTLTLDPADTLLHLGLHAGLEGGDRLLWLKDLERAVVSDPPDWDDVVRRARDWRVNLMVGAMLARARVTMSAPVPPSVLADLVPNGGWRRFLLLADRLFPPERSTGRGNPATLAVRASRATVPATAANMLHGMGARFDNLVRTGSLRRHDVRQMADDPGSVLYPAGGEPDREAYLLALDHEP